MTPHPLSSKSIRECCNAAPQQEPASVWDVVCVTMELTFIAAVLAVVFLYAIKHLPDITGLN